MSDQADNPSPGDDSSTGPELSGRTWHLRGQVQDLLIVPRLGQPPDKSHEAVPGLLIVAELDRWLSSVFNRRICQELYEAVTGMGSSDLLLHSQRDGTEQLRRRLAQAFRDGELLALPLTSPRRRVRGGGGGAASAAAAPVPLLPDSMAVQNSAPEERKPTEEKEEQQEAELSWLAIDLVDEDGTPIGDVRYRVVLPNGEVREGTLDAQGHAVLEDIAAGTCKVIFPDLDDSDESQGGEAESDDSESDEEDDL